MFLSKNVFISSLILIAVITLFSGCASYQEPAQPLHKSTEYYNYIQPDFAQYVQMSRARLAKNRQFITDDYSKEIDMNAPIQLSPSETTNKAVLLVHGLGDSPFTFHDIANDMVKQGFHVEVLLLPGHGSNPVHMMLPTYTDWQFIVDHYASLLKQRYQHVWLGGFSTGANLVTTHAIENPNISGLLLFSPGFQSKAGHLEKLTPLISSIVDWGWRAEETNLAKYSSSPTNSALAYMRSAQHVRKLLASNTVDVPTLIVMSENDSVIDPEAIKGYFAEQFTHAANQMIWYGETEQIEENIVRKSMQIPIFNISTASHMSVTFKPCNPYYGLSPEKLICENGLSADDKAICNQGTDVWFSAWGYSEEGKIHARLTWNPHYSDLLRRIEQITTTPAINARVTRLGISTQF